MTLRQLGAGVAAQSSRGWCQSQLDWAAVRLFCIRCTLAPPCPPKPGWCRHCRPMASAGRHSSGPGRAGARIQLASVGRFACGAGGPVLAPPPPARLVQASPPNWHGLGGTAVGQAALACLALEANDPGLRAFATNPRGCLYGSELSCIQTSLAIAVPAIRLFCRVLALAVDQVGVCGVVPCP